MVEKRLVIVSYDIVDDKRRNRVARLLTGYGERIQYSVFRCFLNSSQRRKLKKAIEKVINKEEDSVYYFRLCQTCLGEIDHSGAERLEYMELVAVI